MSSSALTKFSRIKTALNHRRKRNEMKSHMDSSRSRLPGIGCTMGKLLKDAGDSHNGPLWFLSGCWHIAAGPLQTDTWKWKHARHLLPCQTSCLCHYIVSPAGSFATLTTRGQPHPTLSQNFLHQECLSSNYSTEFTTFGWPQPGDEV